MKKNIAHLRKFIVNNKKTSTFILLIIITIAYWGIKSYAGSGTSNQYYLGEVKVGNVSSTVSGTGQVSTSNQIDLKTKVTADVINIPVKEGQEVKAGTTVIQLDSRNAEIALESARIAYQKLTKPADKVTMLQTQNALESANDTLKKAYGDGYSSVVGAFLDIPNILVWLENTLKGSGGFLSDQKQLSSTEAQFRSIASQSYEKAHANYDAILPQYKNLSTNSSKDDIETMINITYDAMRNIAQAIKDTKYAIDFLNENGSTQNKIGASTAQTDASTWSATASTDIDALLSAKSAISNGKLDVREKSESLIKLQNGADELDIRSEALNLKQKQYDYENYFVKAPFDGIIAKIDVKKGDSASGIVATLITKHQIANISLNEVDAVKVKNGQKVKLTFDAISDLTIEGEVTKIDLVGTMSQGVVTYNVEITFDIQDPRVKPGMSVSAEIITDTRENVIVIPNSAIKSRGKISYVETFDKQYPATVKGGTGVTSSTLPRQQNIEIGITNDTETEVISGIKIGDIIVTRTVAGTAIAKTAAPTATSLFGGNRGASNGAVRIGR